MNDLLTNSPLHSVERSESSITLRPIDSSERALLNFQTCAQRAAKLPGYVTKFHFDGALIDLVLLVPEQEPAT